LFDSDGVVGSETFLNTSTTYTSRSLTNGKKYYIKVMVFNSADGTYKIAFNTSSAAPGTTAASGTEANPIQLYNGSWTNGNITNSSNAVWYSFNVTSGTTYYVWWNDSYQGDNTKTSDIYVSAYYSNGASIFSNVDSAYYTYTAQSFTAYQTGTVKLRVDGNTGTFAIAYSTSSSRPY